MQTDAIVKALMQQRAELIGYAWLVVGDADAAEDVFQEVSVAAIRKADEINDADHLTGWLYQAIRLQGLKARRDQQQARQLLSPDVLKTLEGIRSNAPAEQESDRMAALRECINRLQGEVRKVLELRYHQNLKPAAIAEQTGKKIQTVYKTITRTHAMLRDCVRERLSAKGDAR